ncbi:CHAP domain-containing protein [Pseudoclavibacter alba]|uniref:CHAP domain-containing protein n=1 Tax=Pseudoclavibacter albus TaxID=272241 RepID=UPI0019D2667B|nr:CHAP domain-containing protein [Pseudoclavibacter alba]MBN6778846.1 CHAP domain-containing protein [Pseudoclavibacter alba]
MGSEKWVLGGLTVVGATLLTPAILMIAATLAVVLVLLGGAPKPAPAEGSAANLAGAGYMGKGIVGDDYPYKGMGTSSMSPLGYMLGNCTDFVAWRLNRDIGVTGEPWQLTWGDLTPGGGDGFQWGASTSLPGWTVTADPVPGDIISTPVGLADWGSDGNPAGHVAYIGEVYADGSILVENYGYGSYYTFTKTREEVKQAASLGVVIKHNPANVPQEAPGGGGEARTDDLKTPAGAQSYALSALSKHGWGSEQGQCLVKLWTGESGWMWNAENPSSGAYGIVQALPPEKMASAGADWKTNPATQINWGLGYIKERYGSPCEAWNFWNSNDPHWY